MLFGEERMGRMGCRALRIVCKGREKKGWFARKGMSVQGVVHEGQVKWVWLSGSVIKGREGKGRGV